MTYHGSEERDVDSDEADELANVDDGLLQHMEPVRKDRFKLISA